MNIFLMALMIPGCANVLTVDATKSLETELISHLSALEEAACVGAEVSVEEGERGYFIEIRRDGQEAETLVENKEDAFAMVSAFLAMPRLGPDPAPSRPIAQAPSRALPWVSISAMAGANAAGPPRPGMIFGGGDLEIASALSPTVFVALRGGVIAARQEQYLPLRIDAGARFFDGALLAGLGGGALVHLARRERIAPMIELMVRGVTPIFENVSGFVELNGTYAFTDEQIEVPQLNAGLRLGVTWEIFHR